MNKIVASLFLVTILIIAFVCYFSPNPNQDIIIDSEDVSTFTTPWTVFINDTLLSSDITVPTTVNAYVDSEVKITNTIPCSSLDSMTIGFRSSQQLVKILLDDEVIYTYGYNKSGSFSKAPGSIWNIVRMPRDSSGKELSIVFTSPYKGYSGKLPKVVFGSRSSIILNIIKSYSSTILMSFAFALIAIVILILHFITARKNLTDPLLYLGMFSFMAAIWSLSESRMLQFFINNQIAVLSLACFSSMILSVSFFLFAKVSYKKISSKVIDGVIIILLLAIVILAFLQISNIYDVMLSISIYHFILLICSVIFMGYLISIAQKENAQEIKAFIRLFSILFVSAGIDMVNFYLKFLEDSAFFFRFGLLVFVVALTVTIMLDIYRIMKKNITLSVLENLAYTDCLTNTKNRTCFEKDQEIYSDPQNLKNLCVIAFDINNLKEVNDNYGHSAGDKLVIECSNCIKEALGDSVVLYRTGGDEFIALAKASEYQHIKQATDKIYDCTENIKFDFPFHLTIAYGIAIYDEMLDSSFQDVCHRADSAMYQKKAQMKSSISN